MVLLKKSLFFIFAFLLVPLPAIAGPWMNVGDAQLRHHVQVLADASIVTVPVTTWPLMWSGVVADIEAWQSSSSQSNAQKYPDYIHQSIAYVQQAHRQQTQSISNSVSLNVRDNINIQPDFGDNQREEQLYSMRTELMNDWAAVKLQASYAPDALDEKEYRYDGSYMAGVLGNWAVSVGAIDRWWGPGWQSSMILSNSARPVPGFALQRNYSQAFNAPMLKWLGPWQLIMFAGQLESDRFVSDAKLLGMRMSFRPINALEMGLSRTAQWGGEGRPQNLDSFIDLSLGKDNAGSSGITKSNEPGNQLAGIDFRLNQTIGNKQFAFYGQIIGEDEADLLPSRRIVLAGVDAAFSIFSRQNRIALEYADSAANGFKGDPIYNYAYEHGIYKSGYRYQGRPIGFALDNDTRKLVIDAKHYFDRYNTFTWSIADSVINVDGLNRYIGGNVWRGEQIEFILVRAAYEKKYSNRFMIKFGLDAFSEEVIFHKKRNFYLNLKYFL